MFLEIAKLLGGLILLGLGGELLVRGAVAGSKRLGMSQAVAGLTIVAFGTSAPEFVVSLMAAAQGSGDIAVANVVGSNIFNIAAVLGLCGMIWPMTVHREAVRFDWPFLFLTEILAVYIFWDRRITSLEGLVFLAGMIIFLVGIIRLVRSNKRDVALEANEGAAKESKAPAMSLFLAFLLVGLGSGILVLGARWMLSGSIFLAREWGISERVIGLTIVGAGTGLPELAASLVASFRRYDSIALGNIIGSCIMNILWILGFSSIFRELNLSSALLTLDTPVMILVTLFLLPMILKWQKIGRRSGLFLFTGYVAYVVLLFLR